MNKAIDDLEKVSSQASEEFVDRVKGDFPFQYS